MFGLDKNNRENFGVDILGDHDGFHLSHFWESLPAIEVPSAHDVVLRIACMLANTFLSVRIIPLKRECEVLLKHLCKKTPGDELTSNDKMYMSRVVSLYERILNLLKEEALRNEHFMVSSFMAMERHEFGQSWLVVRSLLQSSIAAGRFQDLSFLLDVFSKYSFRLSPEKLKKKKVDLITVVMGAFKDAERKQKVPDNVELVFIDPGSENYFVWGHEGIIISAIVEFIANAVNAMPKKGGKIEIQLFKELGTVKIMIQDNGKGIPKIYLPNRIFEQYVTTRKGTTDVVKGGEGLFNAYQYFVGTLKGGLTVDSRVRMGTVFTITLPDADVCSSKESIE